MGNPFLFQSPTVIVNQFPGHFLTDGQIVRDGGGISCIFHFGIHIGQKRFFVHQKGMNLHFWQYFSKIAQDIEAIVVQITPIVYFLIG